MKRIAKTAAVLLCALQIAGCAGQHRHAPAATSSAADARRCSVSPPPAYEPSPITLERDRIFTLVSYAVVFKDWQDRTFDPPGARGYNIGSVLVDENDRVVCWARNNVIRLGNGTQHGEVRLMVNYLQNNTNTRNLREYRLYTTLEPCAMCSGMMTLQSLPTTIFGQTDPDFGDALERLALDSSGLPDGYCPYPRGVQSVVSDLGIREQLDDTYAEWRKAGRRGLTSFLASPEARGIYERARDQLESYELEFPAENQSVLDAAREFLLGVPAKAADLPYTIGCGGGT